MMLASWLAKLRKSRSRRSRSPGAPLPIGEAKAGRRPDKQKIGLHVERFEERTLLAGMMFTVDTTNDTTDVTLDGNPEDAAGDTSLRAAIQEANNEGACDVTIIVPAGTINLSIAGSGENAAASGDLDLTNSQVTITIRGAGVGMTIIDGAALDRVFEIADGADVRLEDLTVQNGMVNGSGGGLLNSGNLALMNVDVLSSSATDGGGIASTQSLNIFGAMVSGNSASNSGGGLDLSGQAFIAESTISNNSGLFGAGGIHVQGSADISRSTIGGNPDGGNTTDGNGGGIFVGMGGNLNLIDTAVLGNTATAGSGSGGGIYSLGMVHLSRSDVSHNEANDRGAGIAADGGFLTIAGSTLIANSGAVNGGGLSLQGPAFADIRFSEFSLNEASNGAGIDVQGGRINIENSTIADGNATSGGGGGLRVAMGGDARLVNSTIGMNVAAGNGGGILVEGGRLEVVNATISANTADVGGGITSKNNSEVRLGNTIVAGNTGTSGDPDLSTASSFDSSGSNLIGVAGPGLVNGVNGDLVGTMTMPLDPVLGPLQDNKGSTRTFELQTGSPALDAGNDAIAPETEQRGSPRSLDSTSMNEAAGQVDIGAYEANFLGFFVDTTNDTTDDDTLDGLALDAAGDTSLRAAIQQANSDGVSRTIVIPGGEYSLLEAGIMEDAAATGDLDVTSTAPLTILGNGGDVTGIDGRSMDRVFDLHVGTTVELRDLSILNGRAQDGGVGHGGGIRVDNATVTLERIEVRDSRANNNGGGIYSSGGGSFVSVIDSRLENNRAAIDGGALYTLQGQVDFDGSFIANNEAEAGNGGGAFVGGANSTITASEFANNRAAMSGGGLAIDEMSQPAAEVAIGMSRIADNTAGVHGGGVYVLNEDVTVSDSDVRNNVAQNGDGGGLLNSGGELTVERSTVENNRVDGMNGDGAGIGVTAAGAVLLVDESDVSMNMTVPDNGEGGGIWVDTGSTAMVVSTTVAGNAASMGAGILSSGTLTVTNSTISGNAVNAEFGYGGGVALAGLGTAVVESSTITENEAELGGGIGDSGSGVTLKNTIVAGNFVTGVSGTSSDLDGSFTSNGNNLIGDAGFVDGFTDGTNGDIVGGTMSFTVTDASNTAPIRITADGHGFANGDLIRVFGVFGNEAANGNFTITVFDANSFDLNNSMGSGMFMGGGQVSRLADPRLTQLQNNTTPDDPFGQNPPPIEGMEFGQGPEFEFTPPPLVVPAESALPLTHALLPDSPAVDAGNNAGAPTTDQRGIARPVDGDGNMTATVDMGAVELFYTVVSGRVFDDVDGDEIESMGETGVLGITVYLDSNENGRLDLGEPNTTTVDDDLTTLGVDETGTFVLGFVPPGESRISIQRPGGFRQTTPAVAFFGTADSAVSISDPEDLVLADLNRDGFPELIAVDPMTNSLFVSFADPMTEAWLTPTSITVGSAPVAVTVDDVELDGDEDLLVVARDSDAVFLLRNRGDGTFDAPVSIAVGSQPTAVTVADADNNGSRDLLVTNSLSDNVTVLLNDGFGNFSADATVPVGAGPVSITVLDVDQDGDNDFVTADRDAGQLTIVRLGGQEFFTTSTITFPAENPISVVASDFDLDGLIDLSVVFQGGDVVVLRATGDGTFEPPVPVGSVTSPSDLEAVDVDNDGDFDLLATSELTMGVVTVFENDSNQGFLPGVGFATGQMPRAIALGDFNEDGLLDVATANVESDDITLLANLAGSLGVSADTGTAISGASFGIQQLAMVRGRKFHDLNRNGAQDMGEPGLAGVEVFLDVNGNGRREDYEPSVLTRDDDPGTMEDETGVYDFFDVVPGDYFVTEVPQAGFLQTVPMEPVLATRFAAHVGDDAHDVELLDIDGDGHLDMAVLNRESVDYQLRIFIGDGLGNFRSDAIATVGDGASFFATGDLDGDADVDFVVTNAADDTLSILEYSAGSLQTRATPSAGAQPQSVELSDVDGDGDEDIVVGNANSVLGNESISIFTNNGSFSFGAPVSVGTGGSVIGIAVHDLDLDGDPDVVAADFDQSRFRILRNDGGSFVLAGTVTTGANPRAIEINDVNHDGFLDIVIASDEVASGSVHIHQATGLLQYPDIGVEIATGDNPKSLTITDLNNDGEIDIAVTSSSDNGQISVLFGQGDGMFSAAVPFSSGGIPAAVTSGDVNQDGHIDLVTAGQFEGLGEVNVLLNRTGTHQISLSGGQLADMLDFGNVQVATIEGVKFHDLDGDGVFDMNEPPLEGFTIFIDENDSGTLDPFERSAVTGPDGRYFLGDVPPVFPLQVREILPQGWKQTLPNVPTFQPAVSLDIASDPRTAEFGNAVASGDFDGDGRTEIVAANPDDNSISVIRISSETGFQERIDLAAGTKPVDVKIADLNGDDKLDIVVSNNDSSSVSVFFGNGNGTFQTASHVTAGGSPRAIAIADLNGDTFPDVAVTSDSSDLIQFLINDGMGGFANSSSIQIIGISGAQDIVAADIDGDGDDDLALVSVAQDRVSIVKQTAPGAFGAADAVAVGDFPAGIAAADIDGDADIDLFVTNRADATYQFLTNDGTGGFTAGTATSLGTSPEAVDAADVDGNGTVDFVVADQLGANVILLQGDGAGGISGTLLLRAAGSQDGVAFGDLDGDTRPEIVTTVFNAGTVDVFRNLSGVYVFSPTPGQRIENVDFGNLALPGSISGIKFDDVNENGVQDMSEPGLAGFTIFADLNNDDVLDMGEPSTVTASDGTWTIEGLDPLREYTISEVQQNGFVQLAPTEVDFATDSIDSTSPHGIIAELIDDDLLVDLVAVNESGNEVLIHLGEVGGSFDVAQSIAVGATPVRVLAAHLNNDTEIDLVVVNEGSNNVSVLIASGGGSFNAAVNYPVGSDPDDLQLGDVNDDTFIDILTSNSGSDSFSILLNAGNGTFGAASNVSTGVGTAPRGLVLANLNADTHPDVAVTTPGDDRIHVFINNGTGGYTAGGVLVAGTDPERIAASDLNDDEELDLIVANTFDGTISVLLGDGMGGFGTANDFAVGADPSFILTEDLDGDGVIDVIVSNDDSDDLALLIGQGDGSFEPARMIPAGKSPGGIASLDLNSDGDPDLAVSATDSNEILLLTNARNSHVIDVGAGEHIEGIAFGNREINDAPTIMAPGATQNVDEDTDLIFSSSGGNQIVVADVDAGTQDIEAVLSVTGGILTLASTMGLAFPSGGDGESSMTVVGQLAAINAALDGLKFSPTPETSGAATLNISVNDLGNTGFGGAKNAASVVNIMVNSINDQPTISVPGSQTTAEDADVVFSSGMAGLISIDDIDAGMNDVSLSLAVTDGTLTLSGTEMLMFDAGGNGQASMTIRGKIADINNALTDLVYSPDENFSGGDTLNLAIDDLGNSGGPFETNSAAVAITVDAVNDAPTFDSQQTTFAIDEHSTAGLLVHSVAVTDVDSSAGQLSFAIVSGNTGNAFAIDSNGDITVNDADAVDFEAVETFNLDVEVTDSNPTAPTPLKINQTFTINLNDLAESFIVPPSAFANGAVTLSRSGMFLTAKDSMGVDVVPPAVFANVTDVAATARDGSSDTLEISGTPFPDGGILFDGGASGNGRLAFPSGTAFTDLALNLASGRSGTIDLDGDIVAFVNVEKVIDELDASTRSFQFGNENNAVTIENRGTTSDSFVGIVAGSGVTLVDFRFPSSTLTISTGSGDDQFSFDNVTDAGYPTIEINGEGGADMLDVSGASIVGGGAPNFRVAGGAGGDILIGGDGDDVLVGGEDDDDLAGGKGNDSVDGGGGNDDFTYLSNGGDDTFAGGDGSDRVLVDFAGLGEGSPIDAVRHFITSNDSGLIAASKDVPFGGGFVTRTGSIDFSEVADVIDDTDSGTTTVDFSAVNTPLSIALSDAMTAPGDVLVSAPGTPSVTLKSAIDAVVIEGGTDDDSLTVGVLPVGFVSGIRFDGQNGDDSASLANGLPGDGLHGDVIILAETITIAGTIQSTSSQVLLDGDTSLIGPTTINADTVTFTSNLLSDATETLDVTGNTELQGDAALQADARFRGPTVISGDFSVSGTLTRFDDSVEFNGVTSLSNSVVFQSGATFDGPATIFGAVSASGGAVLFRDDVELDGGSVSSSGEVIVGRAAVMGSAPVVTLSGGELFDADVTLLNGAVLSPGSSPGRITTNDLMLQPGAGFSVEIDGPVPATGFDQVVVNGSVDVMGAVLDVTLGQLPVPGATYVIVDNDGTDAVTGTFSGLPEGAIVSAPSSPGFTSESFVATFAITYAGGDGNDIELEPTATVSGFVWDDESRNGIFDGDESGRSGVTVRLVRGGTSSVLQTTTSGDGSYEFRDLAPGSVSVQVVAPSGTHFSPQNRGRNDSLDSDVDINSGLTAAITLSPGEVVSDVAAGIVETRIIIRDADDVLEGNRATDSATSIFTVALSGPAFETVAVNVEALTGDGGTGETTATLGVDFRSIASAMSTLTFISGQTQQTVRVSGIADRLIEEDEVFEVRLSNATNAVIGDGVATGRLLNDDVLNTSVILQGDNRVMEGNAPDRRLLAFDIVRLGPINRDVTVTYETVAPPFTVAPEDEAEFATPDVDFVTLTETVTIPAGQMRVTVFVEVIGDDLNPAATEFDELVKLRLTNATVDGNAIPLNSRAQAIGLIEEDDVLEPVVSIGNAEVVELDFPSIAVMRFPVTLDGPSQHPITISYRTLPGMNLQNRATPDDDFESVSADDGRIVIPEGRTEGFIEIVVRDLVPNGGMEEADELLAVELLDVASAGSVTIGDRIGIGTILDDDSQITRAFVRSGATVNEGRDGQALPLVFVVGLSGPVDSDVIVTVSTVDRTEPGRAVPDVDYAPISRREFRIPAGRANVSVPVDVFGDEIGEPNETVELRIDNVRVVGGDADVRIESARRAATGAIVDDDREPGELPRVSIDRNTSVGEKNGQQTSIAEFTVRLSEVSDEDVTVEYRTINAEGLGLATPGAAASSALAGGDFRRVDFGMVTFEPGQTEKAIRIVVNGDDSAEPPEDFFVRLVDVTTANAKIVRESRLGKATIIDNDGVAAVASIQSTTSVTERDVNGFSVATVTVNLSRPASSDVVLGWVTRTDETLSGRADSDVDFEAENSGTVTIFSGQSTATISVRVIGDNLVEGDEDFEIELTSVETGNATLAAGRQSVVTIVDNDFRVDDPLPTVRLSSAGVDEGDAGPESVDPDRDVDLVFDVSLTGPVVDGTVLVEVGTVRQRLEIPGLAKTEGPERDVYRTTRTLFFDPGVTLQEFRVQVIPDTRIEPDEVVFVEILGVSVLRDGIESEQRLPNRIQAAGVIRDDDSLIPTISISSPTVFEGDGTITLDFDVVLDVDSALPPGAVFEVDFETIDLTAIAGEDYVASQGTLTFRQGEETQTVSITVNGDQMNEAPEEFLVELSDPQGAMLDEGAFQGVGRIENDDSPGVVFQIDSVTQREGNGDSTDFEFLVRRIGNSQENVSIGFRTMEGTAAQGDDFRSDAGRLVFRPDGSDLQSVFISVRGDRIQEEEEETFFVTLMNPVGATIDSRFSQGTGTILDDDERVFRVIPDDLENGVIGGDDVLARIIAELEPLLERVGNDPNHPDLIRRITSLSRQVLTQVGLDAGYVLITDPVTDNVTTDPNERTFGFTESSGEVTAIPAAYYSGPGNIELTIIPSAPTGVYGLQVSQAGSGEFRFAATLMTSDGFERTITQGGVLDGTLNLALDFTDQPLNPIRDAILGRIADAQGNGSDQAAIADAQTAFDPRTESLQAALQAEFVNTDLSPGQLPQSIGGAFSHVFRSLGEFGRDVRDSVSEPLRQLFGRDDDDENKDPNKPPLADPQEGESDDLDRLWTDFGKTLLGAPGSLLDLSEFFSLPKPAEDSESNSEESQQQDENGNPPADDDDQKSEQGAEKTGTDGAAASGYGRPSRWGDERWLAVDREHTSPWLVSRKNFTQSSEPKAEQHAAKADKQLSKVNQQSSEQKTPPVEEDAGETADGA